MTPWDSLREAVERAGPALLSLPDALTATRPAPGKWSPREIVGHLIDSASNNHRRFVLAQQQEDLVFSGYAQAAWVAAQRYQDAAWEELVSLWRGFNLHLARVMEATPTSDRTRPRLRHNLHEIAFRPVPEDQPATLEYLMRDYVEHLEHHLRQVLTAGATDQPWTPRASRPPRSTPS
jgi:hypothetical protein